MAWINIVGEACYYKYTAVNTLKKDTLFNQNWTRLGVTGHTLGINLI